VYRCVADAATAIDVPGVSSVREVIEAGYSNLIENAGKISNTEWRRSFLENVAENRVLIERWKELHQGKPSG
jgi:hypothetical protein